ncbi:transcriptional regulator FilR1 domain-containing protein [Halegenticoccus tardaugens]|uniref:transcriptional regulator FilR1 domain-containing protein n=1 Tax=Halegenticoccus tardaugens TaxID=2071624 RepID=UPI00100A88D9|nr:MarR family transcriptional regulator [Halegenticoccus tardaugens]
MDAQELVGYLTTGTGSQSIDPLQALSLLREDALSQAELATQCGVARKSASQFVKELTAARLVTQTKDGNRLTGVGAIALNVYSEAHTTIGAQVLTSLTKSPSRRAVLRRIGTAPCDLADLASNPDLPSRSTVYRALQTFREHDLIAENGGQYHLTEHGEHVLQEYDELLAAFEQLIEKSACLQDFDAECETFPVRALEDERLVIGRPSDPLREVHAFMNFINSVDENEVTHIRGFSSYFDLQYTKAVFRLVDAGVRLETVISEEASKNPPSDPQSTKYIRKGLQADNVEWSIYPGELPLGLMIIDSQWVVAGPKIIEDASTVSGTIFVEDPEVIEWAHALFDDYQSRARAPLEHLVYKFRSVTADAANKVSR